MTDRAADVFSLNIYETINGIALVGDGQERYNVPVAALEVAVEITQPGSDAERIEYDKWCTRWIISDL